MCFTVTFIDTSLRGATAIAFVRCCLKLILSGASEEFAIAPPSGSISAKPKDEANVQPQPSQYCRPRTSGYTRYAGISGIYSIPDSFTAYGLTEILQFRYD